jgi:NhaC family Na+:H+ antiporter
MDLILALSLSFAFLLLGTLQRVFIAYPLAGAMGVFWVVLMRRGFGWQQLLRLAVQGSRRALPVLNVLLLIGVVIASWMAAGTVPALVYYGVQWVHPQSFLLMAFLLTAGVSVLIGTSFGAVGTVGIALMMMAQGSDLAPTWLAGAVIAGAYVGDRCSPMSSSALLVAAVTHTRLYDNLRRMGRTSGLPLLLSGLVYWGLSWLHPIHLTQQSLAADLDQIFHIQPLLLLPAVVILGLSIAQVEVKRSMLASAGVAIALALSYQHYSLGAIARFLILGFHLETHTYLDAMLRGGGILSMARVALVVLISTAFVGLFAGTHLLDAIQRYVARSSTVNQTSASEPWGSETEGAIALPANDPPPENRLLMTGLVGLGAAAFGCTQTIAILLTEQLMRPKYAASETGNAALALDLENTVVVISALIPWNIAGLVPATLLQTDYGFIPFACYLYLLPIAHLISLRLASSTPSQPCN